MDRRNEEINIHINHHNDDLHTHSLIPRKVWPIYVSQILRMLVMVLSERLINSGVLHGWICNLDLWDILCKVLRKGLNS